MASQFPLPRKGTPVALPRKPDETSVAEAPTPETPTPETVEPCTADMPPLLRPAQPSDKVSFRDWASI